MRVDTQYEPKARCGLYTLVMTKPRGIYHNPAGRLLKVMNTATELSKNQTTADINARDAWAGILGVPNLPAPLTRAFASVAQLIIDVRWLVEALDVSEHPDFLLRNYEQIEAVSNKFAMLGQQSVAWSMNDVQDTGIDGLEGCAAALSRHMTDVLIDDDRLVEWRQTIETLIIDIEDSDLDLRSRAKIVELLGDILTALVEYEFFGSEPVEAAANRVTGWIVATGTRFAHAPVVHRTWAVAQGIAVVLGMAAAVQQLALPGSTSPSPAPASITYQTIIAAIDRPSVPSQPEIEQPSQLTLNGTAGSDAAQP